MFSKEEKSKIAKAVETILLEIGHPEMPKEKPMFYLHVIGKDPRFSWADIKPNWYYDDGNETPTTTTWNENAREIIGT